MGAPTRLEMSPTVAPLRRPLHSTVLTLSGLATQLSGGCLPLPGPFRETHALKKALLAGGGLSSTPLGGSRSECRLQLGNAL